MKGRYKPACINNEKLLISNHREQSHTQQSNTFQEKRKKKSDTFLIRNTQ